MLYWLFSRCRTAHAAWLKAMPRTNSTHKWKCTQKLVPRYCAGAGSRGFEAPRTGSTLRALPVPSGTCYLQAAAVRACRRAAVHACRGRGMREARPAAIGGVPELFS